MIDTLEGGLVSRPVIRAPEGSWSSFTADALVDAGVRLFTVGVGGPDYDLGRLRQWLRWRDAQRSTA